MDSQHIKRVRTPWLTEWDVSAFLTNITAFKGNNFSYKFTPLAKSIVFLQIESFNIVCLTIAIMPRITLFPSFRCRLAVEESTSVPRGPLVKESNCTKLYVNHSSRSRRQVADPDLAVKWFLKRYVW